MKHSASISQSDAQLTSPFPLKVRQLAEYPIWIDMALYHRKVYREIQGQAVVTDRLHAIVLSWLGGTPVFYVDNSYNKLSNFITTWLSNSPGLMHCTTFEEVERAKPECGITLPAMTSKPA